MANAYTLAQVKTFIVDKTWAELPDEMKESAKDYLSREEIPGYYLIIPTFRADELAELVEGKTVQLAGTMLVTGDLVLVLGAVCDSNYTYAHDFLSGLTIRLVDDSEFPVSDV